LVDATPVSFFDEALQFPTLAMTAEPSLLLTDAPESSQPQDASPIAGAQKEPDSLTGQLAGGLLNIFKTFTGR
jgi:hypothetical protein